MNFDLKKGLELMARYQLKFFDTGDWDGHAGAESFNEMIEPMISEIDYSDFGILIVVDKNGIEVDYYNKDTECTATYQWGESGCPIGSSFTFLEIADFPSRNREEVMFLLTNFMELV